MDLKFIARNLVANVALVSRAPYCTFLAKNKELDNELMHILIIAI